MADFSRVDSTQNPMYHRRVREKNGVLLSPSEQFYLYSIMFTPSTIIHKISRIEEGSQVFKYGNVATNVLTKILDYAKNHEILPLSLPEDLDENKFNHHYRDNTICWIMTWADCLCDPVHDPIFIAKVWQDLFELIIKSSDAANQNRPFISADSDQKVQQGILKCIFNMEAIEYMINPDNKWDRSLKDDIARLRNIKKHLDAYHDYDSTKYNAEAWETKLLALINEYETKRTDSPIPMTIKIKASQVLPNTTAKTNLESMFTHFGVSLRFPNGTQCDKVSIQNTYSLNKFLTWSLGYSVRYGFQLKVNNGMWRSVANAMMPNSMSYFDALNDFSQKHAYSDDPYLPKKMSVMNQTQIENVDVLILIKELARLPQDTQDEIQLPENCRNTFEKLPGVHAVNILYRAWILYNKHTAEDLSSDDNNIFDFELFHTDVYPLESPSDVISTRKITFMTFCKRWRLLQHMRDFANKCYGFYVDDTALAILLDPEMCVYVLNQITKNTLRVQENEFVVPYKRLLKVANQFVSKDKCLSDHTALIRLRSKMDTYFPQPRSIVANLETSLVVLDGNETETQNVWYIKKYCHVLFRNPQIMESARNLFFTLSINMTRYSVNSDKLGDIDENAPSTMFQHMLLSDHRKYEDFLRKHNSSLRLYQRNFVKARNGYETTTFKTISELHDSNANFWHYEYPNIIVVYNYFKNANIANKNETISTIETTIKSICDEESRKSNAMDARNYDYDDDDAHNLYQVISNATLQAAVSNSQQIPPTLPTRAPPTLLPPGAFQSNASTTQQTNNVSLTQSSSSAQSASRPDNTTNSDNITSINNGLQNLNLQSNTSLNSASAVLQQLQAHHLNNPSLASIPQLVSQRPSALTQDTTNALSQFIQNLSIQKGSDAKNKTSDAPAVPQQGQFQQPTNDSVNTSTSSTAQPALQQPNAANITVTNVASHNAPFTQPQPQAQALPENERRSLIDVLKKIVCYAIFEIMENLQTKKTYEFFICSNEYLEQMYMKYGAMYAAINENNAPEPLILTAAHYVMATPTSLMSEQLKEIMDNIKNHTKQYISKLYSGTNIATYFNDERNFKDEIESNDAQIIAINTLCKNISDLKVKLHTESQNLENAKLQKLHSDADYKKTLQSLQADKERVERQCNQEIASYKTQITNLKQTINANNVAQAQDSTEQTNKIKKLESQILEKENILKANNQQYTQQYRQLEANFNIATQNNAELTKKIKLLQAEKEKVERDCNQQIVSYKTQIENLNQSINANSNAQTQNSTIQINQIKELERQILEKQNEIEANKQHYIQEYNKLDAEYNIATQNNAELTSQNEIINAEKNKLLANFEKEKVKLIHKHQEELQQLQSDNVLSNQTNEYRQLAQKNSDLDTTLRTTQQEKQELSKKIASAKQIYNAEINKKNAELQKQIQLVQTLRQTFEDAKNHQQVIDQDKQNVLNNANAVIDDLKQSNINLNNELATKSNQIQTLQNELASLLQQVQQTNQFSNVPQAIATHFENQIDNPPHPTAANTLAIQTSNQQTSPTNDAATLAPPPNIFDTQPISDSLLRGFSSTFVNNANLDNTNAHPLINVPLPYPYTQTFPLPSNRELSNTNQALGPDSQSSNFSTIQDRDLNSPPSDDDFIETSGDNNDRTNQLALQPPLSRDNIIPNGRPFLQPQFFQNSVPVPFSLPANVDRSTFFSQLSDTNQAYTENRGLVSSQPLGNFSTIQDRDLNSPQSDDDTNDRTNQLALQSNLSSNIIKPNERTNVLPRFFQNPLLSTNTSRRMPFTPASTFSTDQTRTVLPTASVFSQTNANNSNAIVRHSEAQPGDTNSAPYLDMDISVVRLQDMADDLIIIPTQRNVATNYGVDLRPEAPNFPLAEVDEESRNNSFYVRSDNTTRTYPELTREEQLNIVFDTNAYD